MSDSQVTAYINVLPLWQQRICNKLRQLIHQADPEIQETIKRHIPFFVLSGNICAIMATKDHVNLFIYDPIAPDPEGIINQGQGNATARSVQIYVDDKLNEKALKNLIKAVANNNRAGGWRNLSQQ